MGNRLERARSAARWIGPCTLTLATLACGGGAGGDDQAAATPLAASKPTPRESPVASGPVAAGWARARLDAHGELQLEHPLGPGAAFDHEPLDLARLADPLAPVVPVVARDAAVVLAFAGPVPDPGDVRVLGADGELTDVTVQRAAERLVLTRPAGWPASPLAHDALGQPFADPAGQLAVLVADVPVLHFAPANALVLPDVLRGLDGPGHAGWLPDDTPPRLVRETDDGQLVAFDPRRDDLRAFVRVYDEHGLERLEHWDPAAGRFGPIPPRSVLALRVSEPLDPASVRAYETLSVVDAGTPVGEPGFDGMRPGVAELSADGRELRFVPRLDDGTFLGFGGRASALRLVLRTRPPHDVATALADAARSRGLQVLDGPLPGLGDRTGLGFELPDDVLDPQGILDGRGVVTSALPPTVELSAPFETLPGDGPDYGVVVHRFLGTARAEGEGVTFRDAPPRDADGDGLAESPGVYGRSRHDVGSHAPGFLTGTPLRTLEHIVDDFNPPKPSVFASPNGEDMLISLGFGLSVPLDAPHGARFQQIHRAGDASPSQLDFEGVMLDLVGLGWAPSGVVREQTIDDLELLVGLSGVNRGRGPNTNQVNGIPVDPDSGLLQQFDCNLLEWHDTCCEQSIVTGLQPFVDEQPPQTAVVSAGTPYTIDRTRAFAPANATGASFNRYIEYPEFNAGLDLAFGNPAVHAFPYDSRFPMLVELRVAAGSTPAGIPNAMRFSPGILTSAMPRFRVYSMGQNPSAHGVPNYSLAAPSPWPPSDFRAGEGGPLVAPGVLTQTLVAPPFNNGMPDIPPAAPILPPRDASVPGCPSNQPEPDWQTGAIQDSAPGLHDGCITQLPVPNSDPYSNWYFANGMFARPLPDRAAFPGPTSPTPTQFYGYGPPAAAAGSDPACVLDPALAASQDPSVSQLEPGVSGFPSHYGDNARYYTLWRYAKRVSTVLSSAARPDAQGQVEWLAPQVDPPLAEARRQGDLRLELVTADAGDLTRARSTSGFVDVEDARLVEHLNAAERPWIAFRATFGSSPEREQPARLDTIALPYAVWR